jgi:hypothetical protein
MGSPFNGGDRTQSVQVAHAAILFSLPAVFFIMLSPL